MNLENTPICHIHNIIKDKAINILSQTSDESIAKELNDVIKLSEFAEKQGQSMENRLKEYKNAIEDLGFIRIKHGDKNIYITPKEKDVPIKIHYE